LLDLFFSSPAALMQHEYVLDKLVDAHGCNDRLHCFSSLADITMLLVLMQNGHGK
jgi:hypothetical protein